MNNDNKLFELCKEVYKRFPEWDDTDFSYWQWFDLKEPQIKITEIVDKYFNAKEDNKCPLYTSDYLLEKLKRQDFSLHYEEFAISANLWYAEIAHTGYHTYADTPLKALLKLVIALDDAGVKL